MAKILLDLITLPYNYMRVLGKYQKIVEVPTGKKITTA
jgi:hypothetical protein